MAILTAEQVDDFFAQKFSLAELEAKVNLALQEMADPEKTEFRIPLEALLPPALATQLRASALSSEWQNVEIQNSSVTHCSILVLKR